MEYRPIFTGEKVYCPSDPVVVVAEMLVASLVSVTFALGIAAPLGSRIVPDIDPMSTWAITVADTSNPNNSTTTDTVDFVHPELKTNMMLLLLP
jgi:hypothetical protein